jgi:hypothetical protein
MEVEEEFLKNAASMARFAEEEIKQFLAWTGKRSPYSRTAEELRAKMQTIVTDIKHLRKEFASIPATDSYVMPHPAMIGGRNVNPASLD